MKFKVLWIAGLMLAATAGQVHGGFVVTVTANTLGGTNWAFSGGTGTVSGSGASSHFLVGGTTANPQSFHASNDEDFDGLSVLSGTNVFGINYIFVRNYGGIPGTNGTIFDGLDFQSSLSSSIVGQSVSLLDGLTLYADDFDIASLNTGTYVMDSYYSHYGTNLGAVTLIVGESAAVPEPASIAMWGLGALGLVFAGRKRRQMKLGA